MQTQQRRSTVQSDPVCVVGHDAASHLTASHNGREYARQQVVPLEGRCGSAFNGDAMLLMSEVRRVSSALRAIIVAILPSVK